MKKECMKKLLLVAGLLSLVYLGPKPACADTLCADFGRVNACLPIASGVDAAFGYSFNLHKSQGLAETPFGSIKINETSKIVFKVGGITTTDGRGAPFLGADYELKGITNPVPGITSIQPGLYGGHDFHTNEWFWGAKASIVVFQ